LIVSNDLSIKVYLMGHDPIGIFLEIPNDGETENTSLGHILVRNGVHYAMTSEGRKVDSERNLTTALRSAMVRRCKSYELAEVKPRSELWVVHRVPPKQRVGLIGYNSRSAIRHVTIW